MTIEDIARICHEVNRVYCRSIGDGSQLPWEEAPQWQRDSVIDGVQFHERTPDAKASDNHDNWLAKKSADGWVWGEVKNPEAKTHPCMVAFQHLPVTQQTKSYLIKAVVNAALNRQEVIA